MKRWIFLTLTLLPVILLAACGSDADSGDTRTPTTTGQDINMTHDPTETDDSSKETQNNSPAIVTNPSTVDPAQPEDKIMQTVNIQVGNTNFTIILYDNTSVQALLAQMPLTINMSELNGNEKYYYLSDSLPTDSQRVRSINIGDLMLYGSDCLVLFYEGFSTSYSYTKLGYIEDTSGLEDILGSGSVQVTFSVASQ